MVVVSLKGVVVVSFGCGCSEFVGVVVVSFGCGCSEFVGVVVVSLWVWL